MHIAKGKLRFSQSDIWNLDQNLSVIISTALTQFKSMKRHGAPKDFLVYSETNPQGDFTEESLLEWEKTIDEMIYAFSPQLEYSNIEPECYIVELIERGHRQDVNGIKYRQTTLKTTPKSGFTEADIEAYEKRSAEWSANETLRRAKGRELFAKYFTNLWD